MIAKMKTTRAGKSMLMLLISAMTMNSNSQTRFIWGKQFGTEKDEYIMNHVIDKNGNIIISGKTTGSMHGKNYGSYDGFITQIDSSGSVKWISQFGTTENEDVKWSAIDDSGCIYLTGSTAGNLKGENFGQEDAFVVKYSNDGKMIWSKQFGTDSTDIGQGIFIDNNGFIYISGETKGTLGQSHFGKTDGFIMKLDAVGDPLFVFQFGTAVDDFCNSIAGNSSSIFACGFTWGDLGSKNAGFLDCYTIQLSRQGILEGYHQFGSEGFDISMAIRVDAENNLYVCGSTSGNLGGQQMGEGDCFLARISNQGKVLWIDQFGTNKHDGARSIELNENTPDGILISGLMNLPPAQAFIRMVDKNGMLLWEKNFGNDGKEGDSSGKSVGIDRFGNLYHAGLTQANRFGPLLGGSDFYLVKLGLEKDSIKH